MHALLGYLQWINNLQECHNNHLSFASVIIVSFLQVVYPHLNYALPVWGPALAHNLLTRLVKMHNCAIRVIGGLQKFDHVLC